MKTKKLQISLRYDVPRELELIKYLESLGDRTGEPKRLLIQGFEKANTKIDPVETIKEPEPKSKPEIKKVEVEVEQNGFNSMLKPF